MERIMLKSKVHKIVVTETNLEYDGSLTLDASLMEAADIVPNEQIHVYNIKNGKRFITYLIKGARDSGVVGINGASAHKVEVGDLLIIATYVLMEDRETDYYMPKSVLVDGNNKIKQIK